MTKQTNRGFTLIELLVVISIIGLLSSVVMSSVNSARKKADNTQRNQIAEEYRKALVLSYDASGSAYPDTGDVGNYYCLGDYPTLGVYNSANVCGINFGPYSENTTINTVVVNYLKGLPVMKTVDASIAGWTYKGPTYVCASTGCKTAQMIWYLQGGGQKCIKGAAPVSFLGITMCTLTLN